MRVKHNGVNQYTDEEEGPGVIEFSKSLKFRVEDGKISQAKILFYGNKNEHEFATPIITTVNKLLEREGDL